MGAKPPRESKAQRRGSRDHYLDAALYDYEYRRRRQDVKFYHALAEVLGGPVLELGCGSGRIAAPIARSGVPVVGLDLSDAMLSRAKQRADRLPRRSAGLLKLVRADLRAVPLGRPFPLIIAGFNTLQHIYDAAELVDLLRELQRLLPSDGCFAFDVLVPDLQWLVRDPLRRWARTRFTHPSTGKRYYYTTNHTYDPITQVVDVKIYYEPIGGGKEQVVRLAHRQFFPQELMMLVRISGLDVVRVFGGFEGEPLDEVAESQLLICGRPEAAGRLRRKLGGVLGRLSRRG